MLEDSNPKPMLPGNAESKSIGGSNCKIECYDVGDNDLRRGDVVTNDLNIPVPEVILLDSDQSDHEVEEIVCNLNENVSKVNVIYQNDIKHCLE